MNKSERSQDMRRTKTRGRLVLAAFLTIAGFFLLTEHRAHLFGVLPYLLLLACPLMHLFMHGGHGRHSTDNHGGHQHSRPRASHPKGEIR
jgi:DUF2933 family protein